MIWRWSKIVNKGSKNEKGFTLVELMVVVIIIGILAAIAVPKFTNASEKAKENSRAAQQKVIESAVQMYYAEKGEFPAAVDATLDLTTLGDYLTDSPKDPQDGSDINCTMKAGGKVQINWDPS